MSLAVAAAQQDRRLRRFRAEKAILFRADAAGRPIRCGFLFLRSSLEVVGVTQIVTPVVAVTPMTAILRIVTHRTVILAADAILMIATPETAIPMTVIRGADGILMIATLETATPMTVIPIRAIRTRHAAETTTSASC